MTLSSSERRDLLQSLLSDYLAHEARLVERLPFIATVLEYNGLLKDNNAQDLDSLRRSWCTRLSALLQSKDPRACKAAIALVQISCDQSTELYRSHMQTWSGLLLKLVSKNDDYLLETAIPTLSSLYLRSVDYHDLKTDVTNASLGTFNDHILSNKASSALTVLRINTLTEHFKTFPSLSRYVLERTRNLCTSCLTKESASPELLAAVGRCMASWHRLASKNDMPQSWKTNLNLLIGTAHHALDRLFDTVNEEEAGSRPKETIAFAELSVDYVESFPTLVQRVRNLSSAISVYISTQIDIAVAVPVMSLLDYICRMYNVYPGCLMKEFKNKSEYTALMGSLPDLHLMANQLLVSMLQCSGSTMARHGKLLARILVRLLGENKDASEMKISIYRLIVLCVQKLGYGFAETVSKEVMQSVSKDLRIVERHHTLTMVQTNVTKNAKRRRTGAAGTEPEPQSAEGVPYDVQEAAIDVVKALLTVYGSAMKSRQSATIDDLIVSRLLHTSQATKFPSAAEIRVKKKLYDCLLAAVMAPSISHASILPMAIRIFSAGQNDGTHELQETCKQALMICDLIVHPRLPPLQRNLPAAPEPTEMDAHAEQYDLEEEYVTPAVTPAITPADSELPSPSEATMPSITKETQPAAVKKSVENDDTSEKSAKSSVEESVSAPFSSTTEPRDGAITAPGSTPTPSPEIERQFTPSPEGANEKSEQSQHEVQVIGDINDDDDVAGATTLTQAEEDLLFSVNGSGESSTVQKETVILDDEDDDMDDFEIPDIDLAGPEFDDI